ncbi:MAG: 50S ribosomal protein L29 [candidate division Zixibacteria bacterium]|nr:50S ribosomal protein L29 [candidate division Zixibacteria bacterium]
MPKTQQLREMTREELVQKKNELLDERFNLNMRKSLKALDNPLRLRHIRREIASIETILKEDELKIRTLADRTTSILSSVDSKKKERKPSKDKKE